MRFNFKNITENLIYVLGGVIIGAGITMWTQKSTLKQMQPTMDKAIEKATNEITNKIEVPKIKKSEPVQIIMSPNNEQIAVVDTCLGDISKLTEGQRKRLQRWLE
ncbi:hypothetical protein [Flagellimonas flava]|uniref:hypothetical protein n=1 Tax=Flagellimonas flava TaxID=570519 RepID=UPI003D653291